MKSQLIDGFFFAKQITFHKIINYFKIRTGYFISKLIKKPIIWGLPYSISIEPSSFCNLHCIECPTGLKTLSRASGNLNFITFMKVVDEIHHYLFNINLYFQGEPFINPRIFDFIKYASNNKIYTSTSTNAHFLNKEIANKIIESKLNRIIISLDGTDQQSYSSYRKGGDYNTVIQGIKNLIDAKKEKNANRPYVIIQFLVLKSNEHQIDKMKQLSKNLGVDELQFKTAQFYDYEKGNPLIPTIPKYTRYKTIEKGNWVIKKKIINKCYKMWHSFVLTWNGDIVPCCFDKNADYIMGNIDKETIENIWRNQKYKQFKHKILKNRKSINICTNCTE